jgi:hypothetical protein
MSSPLPSRNSCPWSPYSTSISTTLRMERWLLATTADERRNKPRIPPLDPFLLRLLLHASSNQLIHSSAIVHPHELPQVMREMTGLGEFPTSSDSLMTFHPACTSLPDFEFLCEQIKSRGASIGCFVTHQKQEPSHHAMGSLSFQCKPTTTLH